MIGKVAIVMGSKSDADVMKGAADVLTEFGIENKTFVISAHRTPKAAFEFASTAETSGFEVIIAGAGMAAHLAGAMAANTTLHVIGIPVAAGPLGGIDALLATVQMPPGVPVATVAIGSPGARNAAILAVQILALSDEGLAKKLVEHKAELACGVEQRSRKLQERIASGEDD